MRSVISDLLAQERPKEADADKVPEGLAPATYDELVAQPAMVLKSLRGAVQKRLVEGVCAGLDLATISADLGFTVRETRRRVLRLVEKIRILRKIHGSVPPNHHTRTPLG